MDKFKFKKLDENIYVIRNNNFAINAYINKLIKSKLYSISIGNYHFEESTIKNAKNRIMQLIDSDKLKNHLFDISNF